MSKITTHVLDTTRGRPAAGIPVTLDFQVSAEEWKQLGKGITDADGRIQTLMDTAGGLITGVYRLTFATSVYFTSQSTKGFYPHVVISFYVTDPAEHYHVGLTLSRYGYTTYRGS